MYCVDGLLFTSSVKAYSFKNRYGYPRICLQFH